MNIQCQSIWPPPKGGGWTTNPLLEICFKTIQFQGKLFTAKFLQAAMAGPILGNDFLRKFRIIIAPETSQILFACTAMALPTAKPFLPNFSQISEPSFSVLPATKPTSMHPIPDSVPAFVKRLLKKFPSILSTGNVMPTPTHGVEHHIHLIQKNLRLQERNSNPLWNPLALFSRSKSPWASPLHMVPPKNGSWRPCDNYHHLNLVNTPDRIRDRTSNDRTSKDRTSKD
jgi:hypothetical protein